MPNKNRRPWVAVAAALGALAMTTSAAASPTVTEPSSLLKLNWTQGAPVAVGPGVTRTTWTEHNLEAGNRTKARILQIVEIDPTAGALTLEATVGKGAGVTETVAEQLDTVTTVLSRHPYAGVNGSLFKSEPKHPDHVLPEGAEAKTMMFQGVSVTDGVLHSSSCWSNGAGTSGAVIQYGIPYITKLLTTMSLTASTGATIRLDDVDREPGRAWGCARDNEDKLADPGVSGLYTDPDEIVVFTDDYQYPVPKPNLDVRPFFTADDDPGFEVVLDANGVVTDAHEGRGGPGTAQVHVPDGGRILQGIGTGAQWLRANLALDDKVTVGQKLQDKTLNRDIPLDASVDVVGSYHQVLRSETVPTTVPNSCAGTETGKNGTTLICTDSRTALGTNLSGHPVLITLTGGEGNEDGDYLQGFAALLDSEELRLVDALNMDGGGSTTLLIGKDPVTPPTDRPAGTYVYRHVADAVYTGVGGYGMYAK